MPDGVQVVGWLWELVPLSLLAWFTVAFVGVFFGREAAWLFGLWNTPGYIWGYVRVFRAFFWVGGLLFLAFILYYHAWGGPLGLLRVGACLRQSDTAVAPILFVTEYQLPYALYLPYSLANYLAFGWPLAWVVGLGSVVDLLKARRRQIKWRAKLELGLVAQGTAGDGAIGRYLARQQMAFVETLERYAPVLTALAVLVVFTATFGAPSLSTAGQGITLVTLGVFLLAFLGLAQMALGHLKERDDLLREHPAEDPAAIRSQFSAWSYVRAILKEAPVNALAIGSSVLFMLWWLTTSNWAGIDRCSECPQPRHPHPSTVFAEVVQFAQELARAGGTARRER